MRSWRKVLRASIIGFPIQAELPFVSARRRTFGTRFGYCVSTYLGYALKSASNPGNLLEQENERLHLSPRFTSLLEPFVPKPATRVSTNPIPA